MAIFLQTVNVRLSKTVLYTINHAKPKAILLNSEFHRWSKAIPKIVPSVEHVIWLMITTPMPHTPKAMNEAMLAQASDEYEFEDLMKTPLPQPSIPAVQTGNPKGVFFSHRQIVMHTLVVAVIGCAECRRSGLRYSDVLYANDRRCSVSMLGVSICRNHAGTGANLSGRYLPSTMVDLVKTQSHHTRRRANDFGKCYWWNQQPPRKIQRLKKMVIGGSKSIKDLPNGCSQRHRSVYGLWHVRDLSDYQHCQLWWNIPTHERRVNKLSIAACLARQCHWSIWKIWHNGKRMPNDGTSTGEIVVRSPWLTQSYYKIRTQATSCGGRLSAYSGHRLDGRKGNVKITDRLKDVIKSGANGYLRLKWKTIMSLHRCVADIAVIGDSWCALGERPMALIVLKPDYQDTKSWRHHRDCATSVWARSFCQNTVFRRMWNLSRNCQNQRG